MDRCEEEPRRTGMQPPAGDPEVARVIENSFAASTRDAGFHDEVLGAGGLPMDVLERRIHAWIERTKTAR